jgi:hypothetical protein
MMFSYESTACSLQPTNGKQDNQQMIDAAPFEARLDAALALHNMENAEFAAHFGPTGQQLVNRWRARGRIGTPSIPKVRDLLHRTNIDWLQEGIGEPERFTSVAEPSPSYDVRPSYAARLDLPTLAKAVRVMSVDESQNGVYSPLLHAIRLLGYYDRLATGEPESSLLVEVAKSTDSQGSHDARDNGAANGGK